MLKINTKEYQPIEFEVDGTVYKTKKLVYKTQMEIMKIDREMHKAEDGSPEQLEKIIEMLLIYTPLERDFIENKFGLEDMQAIIEEITKGIKTPEVEGETEDKKEEFPLAGGSSGEELPK